MSSKFNLGDSVINNSTNEKGTIIEVYPPRRGRQLYKVKYDDGRENDDNSLDLSPNIQLSDPFKRCEANYYGYYTEYLKGNTAFKIRSSNNSTISSLKASRTLFKAYQFKPLLKYLNSDSRRLLIADEVGLGKTIEAGHILLELKARGELKNALIICPMSLRAKWQTELNEKFGLDFIEVEKKDTLIHEFKNHNGHVRAVINYDKVRVDSDIIKCIEEKNIKFSIIVCDESHNLRNRNLTYEGTRKVLEYSNSVVFMSATPIMLDESNLFNQLQLLDSETYNNEEVFRNNLQLNRPFVRALSQLNDGRNLVEIKKELKDSVVATVNTIGENVTSTEFKIDNYFKEYPLYQKIIKNLTAKNNNNLAERAQIQYDLSVMNPMNSIFTRTRKKEVTKDWTQAVRNPIKEEVSLYSCEQEAYEDAIENYADNHQAYDEYGNLMSGNLGIITFKRQLASSVWGTLNTNESLDREYDLYASEKDAKVEALQRIIETVLKNGNKKIIVFAIFKKTLKYLRIRLGKLGYKCAVMYGDPHINKNEVLQQFQKDDNIPVLLSSEVGSEGLDMQFCNSLVNYDLPWNPMVVEQRIGRIDRFGQESPKVNIFNIIVRESILEDIYSRLLMRIGIFKESIGDLEAILEKEITQDGKTITLKEAFKNMARDYYSDKLTKEEAKKKEKEIKQAFENEKLNLRHIEEGLTNTLTNDSYFQEEIRKIEGNKSYVTSHELYQFVVQLIKECLTTCDIRETDNKAIYEFIIPKSDSMALIKFLQKYEPMDSEQQVMFRRFMDDVRDVNVLQLTFEQEEAFRDKSLTFINLYHPIIQAAVKFFDEKKDKTQCTFFFSLHSTDLPKSLKKGKYMLAIYKVSVSRTIFGDNPITTDSLYPILFDIDNNKIISDHTVSETVMGCAQVNGEFSPLGNEFRLDHDTIEDLRYDMQDCIRKYVTSHKEELSIRIENNKRLRYEQTQQFYAARIKNFEQNILNQEAIVEIALNPETRRNAERVIPAMRGQLRDAIRDRDHALERIKRDAQLRVTEELKSLNLINIIE